MPAENSETGKAKTKMNDSKILFIYVAPRPDNRIALAAALDFVEVTIQDCFSTIRDHYLRLDKQAFFVEEDNCFPQLLKLFGKLRGEKMQFVVCEVGPSPMTFLEDRPDVKQWLATKGVKSRAILCNTPTAMSKS